MFISIQAVIGAAVVGFVLGWIGCEAYQFYKDGKRREGNG